MSYPNYRNLQVYAENLREVDIEGTLLEQNSASMSGGAVSDEG